MIRRNRPNHLRSSSVTIVLLVLIALAFATQNLAIEKKGDVFWVGVPPGKADRLPVPSLPVIGERSVNRTVAGHPGKSQDAEAPRKSDYLLPLFLH